MPAAEETPTVRCDLADGSRVQVISEKFAVGRKSVYEPLRRSKLFVFVNIASSRSLSRSHREQRAGEMSNYRRGALPIYTNLSRSSWRSFPSASRGYKLRQRNVSSFNDTNAILSLNNEDYLRECIKIDIKAPYMVAVIIVIIKHRIFYAETYCWRRLRFR